MSDPYEVLGIGAQATGDEVSAAYRELAKRHHPDVAPGGDDRMREINAAYDAIVRADGPLTTATTATPRRAAPRRRPRSKPGAWLSEPIRRQLGHELLVSLAPREQVILVADASTWDSPSVRLVVTDRRFLWLRDDAPVARVRFLPYSVVERVEGRVSRLRRQAELRVKPRDGRRLSFAAIRPETLDAILRAVRPRIPSIPDPAR